MASVAGLIPCSQWMSIQESTCISLDMLCLCRLKGAANFRHDMLLRHGTVIALSDAHHVHSDLGRRQYVKHQFKAVQSPTTLEL